MININWCLKVKNGIELIEPNDNMSDSYLKMAEESLIIIKKIEKDSRLWTASTSYYTIYYSLYSIMMKIGVKCEIHKCSIEFMKNCLHLFYEPKDIQLIESAFEIRNDLQYYPDRLIENNRLKAVQQGAADFLIKTRDILTRITEKEIKQIRIESFEKPSNTQNSLRVL